MLKNAGETVQSCSRYVGNQRQQTVGSRLLAAARLLLAGRLLPHCCMAKYLQH